MRLRAATILAAISVDDAVNPSPIASLAASNLKDVARAFVEFVTGEEGQRVLSAAGFGSR